MAESLEIKVLILFNYSKQQGEFPYLTFLISYAIEKMDKGLFVYWDMSANNVDMNYWIVA